MTFCFVLALEAGQGAAVSYRQLLASMNSMLAGSPDEAMRQALRSRSGPRPLQRGGGVLGTLQEASYYSLHSRLPPRFKQHSLLCSSKAFDVDSLFEL